MNKKVIKLENNKEYFQISELEDNGVKYLLVMNVDNESDVKIVKKTSESGEDYILDVEGDALTDLKNKFRSLVDTDKQIYL